jgi:DNA modification methylase
MTEILAFGSRRTNAQLMNDCEDLGYIKGRVLDCTYGKGSFWEIVPEDFTASDLEPSKPWVLKRDFTNLPLDWFETFDTVVFDPPYKMNGTSTGKGPSALDAGYGVTSYRSIVQLKQLHYDGLVECIRVAKPGGHILVKCQDQISSGNYQPQEFWMHTTARARGCDIVDKLFVRGHRPQPAGRRQLHARRDYSTLLVFRKWS